MNVFYRAERKKSPYGVLFMLKGKRVRRFFKSESERKDFIREQRLGTDVEGFSGVEWRRWLDLKRECELAGVTPEQAILGYINTRQADVSSLLTLKDAVYQFMEDRRRSHRSVDYILHLDAVLVKQLIPSVGPDRPINSITKAELEAFLETSNASAFTYKNHRSYVRALFHWAFMDGHLSQDVTAKIKARPTPKLEPEFLTVEQMRRLLEVNAGDRELCALLAIQAFSGLRAANIGRLRRQDIRLAEKQIVIPADKMKGARRHLMEANNVFPNLWAWLERANFDKLFDPREDCLSRYQYRRGLAFASAKVPRLKNALRHSFATYKCAFDGEASKAAYTLAQRDPYILWEHYKGCTTREQAELYAKILPVQDGT